MLSALCALGSGTDWDNRGLAVVKHPGTPALRRSPPAHPGLPSILQKNHRLLNLSDILHSRKASVAG